MQCGVIQMPRKKHSKVNVPMIKTEDAEGHLLIMSKGNQTSFEEEGTLTSNNNNGVITWNCGDITHLNFIDEDFMFMYDAESNVITLTSGDKNIYYNLDDLKKLIEEKGLTIEEMDAILNNENDAEKGDEKDGSKKEDN